MRVKPKRCVECGKHLALWNKSGRCGYHNAMFLRRLRTIKRKIVCLEKLENKQKS